MAWSDLETDGLWEPIAYRFYASFEVSSSRVADGGELYQMNLAFNARFSLGPYLFEDSDADTLTLNSFSTVCGN